MKKYKSYIISVLIALGVGGLSAFLTKDYMNIYDEIINPPLAPPGFVFPIVWTLLYTLMGISSAGIYNKIIDAQSDTFPLKIYTLQLIVNFFWSIIFFGARAYLFAFVWLILLIILVVWMIVEFNKLDKTAACLQIPYLVWLLFAAYLNFMIVILN